MNESEKDLQRKFLQTLSPEGRGILLLDSSDTSIVETLNAGGKENTVENRNQLRYHILRAKNILKHINNVVIDEEFLLYNVEDQPAVSWLLKDRHLIPGFDLSWEEEVGVSEFDKKESITELPQKLKLLAEKYHIKFIRLVLSIDFSEPSKEIPKKVTEKIEKAIAVGKLVQELGIIPYFSLKVGNMLDMVVRKQHLFWHKALAYFVNKLQGSDILLEAIGLGVDLVNAAALQKNTSASLTTIQRDAIKNYATFIRTIPIAVPIIVFETNNEAFDSKAYRTFCLFVNAIFKSDLEFPFKTTYCLGGMLYGTAVLNLKKDADLYYFAYEQMFLKRAEDIEESLKGGFKETEEGLVLGSESISIVKVGTM